MKNQTYILTPFNSKPMSELSKFITFQAHSEKMGAEESFGIRFSS
jgi:hypothetical protein